MLPKKKIFPAQAKSSFVILVLVSLLLGACGDPTATLAPVPTISAVTTAAATTVVPATTVATTAVAPTIAATTAALTTSAPTATNPPAPTTVAATSPAANSLPLDFVFKYDTTANPITWGYGIGLDRQGNLYVVDINNNRIQKYDANGKFVSTWGKKGSGDGEFQFVPASPRDGPNAGFLVVDKEDNVYVTDGYNGRIQKFDSNGQFLAKWGSFGTAPGQFAPPAPGPLSIDADNNLYVGDFNKINKFDLKGNFIASFGSSGSKEGQFSGAAGSIVDKQGNIYVADFLNSRIQKFDSKFNFLTAFGTQGKGNGQFMQPLNIVQDSVGNLYITDNSTRLQKFDPNGKFLGKLTIADITNENFAEVGAVIIDKANNLYVSIARSTSITEIYKYRIKKP